MPLPRPKTIRVIATPEDEHWQLCLVEAFNRLDEPVTVDSSTSESRTARTPTAVVLVWTRSTIASATVHREVSDWDRRHVDVHLLDTGDTEVLGYMQEMVASSHKYRSDQELRLWLHDTVLGIEPRTDHKPEDIPSLTSFGDAVRIYAVALSERLQNIDVVGHFEKLSLEDIFLPLKLREFMPSHGHEEFTTLLEFLWNGCGHRLFIVGTPGAGKSTLLDYAALQLARDTLRTSFVRLPLLLRATDLIASSYSNIVEYVRLVIKGCVPRVGRQVSSTIVSSEELGDARTYLLIDGVDELKRDDRQKLRQLLRTFEIECPNSNIVLSSRPSGYDQVSWAEYRGMIVCPLEVLSARQYVSRFAPLSTREHLLKLLVSSERLRELAQVPFMLALMCSHFEDTGELPLRRAMLIKACVTALLARRPLNPHIGLDNEGLQRCLMSVSDRLFRLNSSGGHGETEFLFALQSFLAERPTKSPYFPQHRSIADQSNIILDEVIERTGLLQRDGEYIDFVHRSIWEYFVAMALGERGIESIDDVAGAIAWEEPLRLMIGLASEDHAREVIGRLWTKNPALALRGAAECAFDMREVLQELLNGMPPGEAAALVRDLGALMTDMAAKGTNERLVLDTLQALLPATTSCEVLWEGLGLLLRIQGREDEARELLMRTFRFDEALERLERLMEEGDSGLSFVEIPGGEFVMGNDAPGRSVDEGPPHCVRVSNFKLSATTVTNSARSLFPYAIGIEGDPRSPTSKHPMIGITWYEAMIFAIWFGCRLPTEAEWEYACRAGGSDDNILLDESRIPEFAWYAENASNTAHPVGVLKANSFGIFDMLGNVREWCWDWFSADYYSQCSKRGSVEDPLGPVVGIQKVLRGGCFDWNTANLVPTYRNSNLPNNKGFQNGVRLVAGMPKFLTIYLDTSRRGDQHPD